MSSRKLGRTSIRGVAFVCVLLLSSALVVTLFDQARAVTMEFRDPSTSFDGSKEFLLDMEIPSGQRVPITDLDIILETQATGRSGTGVAGKLAAVPIARVICPMGTFSGYDCPGDRSMTTVLGGSTATSKITQVRFVGPFISKSDADAGTSPVSTGYYDACPCDGTFTGYGYDTVSTAYSTLDYGYGYGYQTNNVSSWSTENSGNGYGYGSNNLVLRFGITISGSALGSGRYYLTVEAVTGSSTIGRLSSPFQEFTVGTGGGGGGGGATGGTTSTGGTTAAGQTISLTASSTTPPTGATAAWQVTVGSATSGDTLSITLPGTTSLTGPIELLLTQGLTNAQVTITHYTGDGYAAATGTTFPDGVEADGVFEITISTGGGTVGTITIPYKLTTLPDGSTAAQGVLMRLEDGVWVPHGRMQFVQQSDGTWAAEGSAPCCSVFAVAFDTQAPTVSLGTLEETLSGVVTLTADAADNLELLRVEFFVDDQRVGSDTSAPYEFVVDTATLQNGEHTFKAVAYDFVENSAESSHQANTDNEEVTPGGGGGGRGWVLWLVVGLIVVALVVLVVTFAGRKPKAP